MLTPIVELAVALVCLAAAGLILIRLLDDQRGTGRRDE